MGVSIGDGNQQEHSPIPSVITYRLQIITIAGVLASIIVWCSTLSWGALLPLALSCVVYVIWSWRRPVVAVSTILILYLHTIIQSEGISPLELGFGLYFFGYMAFWFLNAFFARKRLLAGVSDLAIIFYILLSLVSIFLVAAEGGSMFRWFRELITVLGLLFYFPLRDALRTPRQVHIVLAAALVMVALIAFYNLFEYRLASIAARYTFELLSGRQIFGGHYFVASTIFACSLFMSASSKWRQLFWSIVLVVSALALALTFSRGFWLGALLGIGVLWLLSEGHSRKRLVVAAVVVSGLATLLVWIFAGRLASFIFEALTNRFLSSGSGLEDLSVAERVAESKDAIRAILQSPLVGHGYGATYVHYNTLEKVTVNWFYAHNAYLFVLFKVGLIGFLGFFTFYIMLIRKGWSSIKNRWGTIIDTEFIRASVAVLIGYLFIATNSGIFIDKAAVLVITMCSVLLSLSDKNASSASPPGGQPGSPLSLEPTLHTNP